MLSRPLLNDLSGSPWIDSLSTFGVGLALSRTHTLPTWLVVQTGIHR